MGRRQRQKTGAVCSGEEIKVLKQQPWVIEVTPDMIIFDMEFKQELYDVWAWNQCMDTIRGFFAKKGADMKAISICWKASERCLSAVFTAMTAILF